ncbi:winged helix-turn-helix domain-containing protein [Vibrio sp. CAU 1672]|uniref:ArsR/SmtB family transcription factor n=1 Tax=Vibrio sp. CAU 1672 TaxID=3032594 RepID=UPI0023DBB5FE|nr:winged helix-turn-helix domain-containing protein [Vibrio sp. CAU 1672]MDF2152696.1 winged helix-turn-helix domain-containing protein [Vibrio sp. CAU 1672]
MSKTCDQAKPIVFETTPQQLDQEQQLAAMAKALAHPARLRILHILHQLDKLGGCLNSDLVSQLGLAQSTVSEHLRILKQAGFISATPNPPKMCYRIQRQQLDNFQQNFGKLFNEC